MRRRPGAQSARPSRVLAAATGAERSIFFAPRAAQDSAKRTLYVTAEPNVQASESIPVDSAVT